MWPRSFLVYYRSSEELVVMNLFVVLSLLGEFCCTESVCLRICYRYSDNLKELASHTCITLIFGSQQIYSFLFCRRWKTICSFSICQVIVIISMSLLSSVFRCHITCTCLCLSSQYIIYSIFVLTFWRPWNKFPFLCSKSGWTLMKLLVCQLTVVDIIPCQTSPKWQQLIVLE